MIAKIIRVFPATRVLARSPLVDGTERVQRLGFLQRKIVILDVMLMDEIQSIIEQEFPSEDGEFCLDTDPSYSDVFHHTHESQNIVLSGSRRIAAEDDGFFECQSFV